MTVWAARSGLQVGEDSAYKKDMSDTKGQSKMTIEQLAKTIAEGTRIRMYDNIGFIDTFDRYELSERFGADTVIVMISAADYNIIRVFI